MRASLVSLTTWCVRSRPEMGHMKKEAGMKDERLGVLAASLIYLTTLLYGFNRQCKLSRAELP